MASVDISAL